MSKIIGIDLGTTNSAVALVKDGQPIILDHHGERIIPSVVGKTDTGQWLIGSPARNQFGVKPENTIRSIKRLMGMNTTVSIGDDEFTPSAVSALILRHLKQIAEQHVGEDVTDAVITVPAYFTDIQRQATQEAGKIAGLNVRRIINEPTAAALAYGLNLIDDQTVLVYDLGGGTFDVSLVELMDGVVEVRASHGDTKLGGDDFDEIIANFLASKFKSEHGVDVREDRKAWARLLLAAEQAKITLSSQPFAQVSEAYLATNDGIPLHLEYELSRDDFDLLTGDLLKKTKESIDRVLEDGKVGVDEIDHVLLVGGSTRMLAVRELIEQELKMDPLSAVNPDEAVALGAAVQGAIIAGEPIDAILVDVTPYSLGMAIADIRFGRVKTDVYKVLIPRNTTIPVTREELFHALHPEQDAIQIRIYQGEAPKASDNTALGDFLLDGLEAEFPGDVPSITVEFDFDVNGMLTVTAKDRVTGKKKTISVESDVASLDGKALLEAQSAVSSVDFGASTEPIVISDETAALIGRARQLIDADDTAESTREQLTNLLNALDTAHNTQLHDQAEALEEELSDLLYDLED